MISLRPVLALSVAGALVLSACGGDDDASTDTAVVTPTINVGRSDDPISQLMAEIYGQGLENSGYRVGRKDPVADQAAAIAGLESDRFQFVPATSGSLLAHLADSGSEGSSEVGIDAQMTAIREQLPATLTVFEPANVDNGLVVVCAAAAIEEFTLATIGDLGDAGATLGSSDVFDAAAVGGLAALNEAYGTTLTVTVVPDVAAAVADGTVDCGVVPALTPSIIVEGLIALDDDKAFAAADMVLTLMTVDAGQADVQAVIDAINATLTTDIVRSLLVKIEVGGDSYDVVAKQFLATMASGQ